MEITKKIERQEKAGFVYFNNYNTGSHILKQALVKETETERIIKTIENRQIKKYRTEKLY